MPQSDDAIFYQLYFQKPGVAETDFERNTHDTMRRILFWGSGDSERPQPRMGEGNVGMVPSSGGLLSGRPEPDRLPAWLNEADLAFYAAEFKQSGFRGGLNWYRNIDRNWELLASWTGAKVAIPALYVAGDRDMVLGFKGMDQLVPQLKQFVLALQDSLILPKCGHWTQQERPEEVNAAMLSFLKGLG